MTDAGRKVGKRRIEIVLLCAFMVLVTVLFLILNNKRQANQQQHLELITERYQLAYNTIYSQYEQLATNVHSELIIRFNIQDIYQKLLTADEDQKNRLRAELLHKMKSRYEELREEGLVKQLQFHLRNNESFLRLHRPDKFGDNLTEIRSTVVFVNNDHTRISGFENGKVYGGYRFVFPITATNGIHLGSMEVSFGPEIISLAIMKQYQVLCNFFISKENALKKAFASEQHAIYAQTLYEDYYYNKNVLAVLEQVSGKEITALRPHKSILHAIYTNAHSGHIMSLYDRDHDSVFTTIPIFNPITHEMVAFCTIRSHSSSFGHDWLHLKVVFLVSSLLLAMSFITFYLQFNQRKTLENRVAERTRELELSKKELQRSEKKFRQIVENNTDVYYETGLDGTIHYCSPSCLDVSGYSQNELIGKNANILFNNPNEHKLLIKSLRKIDSTRNLEAVFKKKNGDLYDVVFNADFSPDDSGNLTRLTGTIRDITIEKKIKTDIQRSKKMEVIGLMAGGVAHDLNNILSGIVGYPELLLLQLPKDSDLRKPIEAIHDSGQRAAMVVADLLTVARGAASMREPHNLNMLIDEYIKSPECIKLKSQYPEITFTNQLQAKHHIVLCSPVHVKKCLMNLVINASEAMGKSGSITICSHNESIGKRKSDEQKMVGGEYIVISVQDTGPGISDSDLRHIFEPFYTKKTMGISGTGLGLAIVWNTMQDHKGKVVVESSEKGTCFKLYFPISNGHRTQTENDDNEDVIGHNEHILIVDDELQLRDIARKMLESLGYTVDTVSSGESALQFVQKNPVDLLVLDMLMEPGINGLQTYKKILKPYPEQKALIASGFSETEDVKAAIKLGAAGFIKKPYSIKQIGRAVKKALKTA